MLQKIKRCMLLALTIVMLAPAARGFAATPKQEALNAYNRWLSGTKVQVMPKGFGSLCDRVSSSQVRFAIAYINNDSIPELIVQATDDESQTFQSILTYRNGKIVRIYHTHVYIGLIKGYYSRTGMFLKQNNYSKGKGSKYLMLGTAGVTERLGILSSVTPTIYTYIAKNGKSVSLRNHTEFKNKLLAFTKGKDLTSVKFYRNTAANRKNILK